jgi:hypothetical protein
MHDVQNVFDSNLTWNHESWQMAKTSQKLIDEGKISPFMIAPIHNNAGKRHDEYFPEEVLNSLPENFRDSIVNKVYCPNENKLFFGKPHTDDY